MATNGWGNVYSRSHFGEQTKKETPEEIKEETKKSTIDKVLNIIGLQTTKKEK